MEHRTLPPTTSLYTISEKQSTGKSGVYSHHSNGYFIPPSSRDSSRPPTGFTVASFNDSEIRPYTVYTDKVYGLHPQTGKHGLTNQNKNHRNSSIRKQHSGAVVEKLPPTNNAGLVASTYATNLQSLDRKQPDHVVKNGARTKGQTRSLPNDSFQEEEVEANPRQATSAPGRKKATQEAKKPLPKLNTYVRGKYAEDVQRSNTEGNKPKVSSETQKEAPRPVAAGIPTQKPRPDDQSIPAWLQSKQNQEVKAPKPQVSPRVPQSESKPKPWMKPSQPIATKETNTKDIFHAPQHSKTRDHDHVEIEERNQADDKKDTRKHPPTTNDKGRPPIGRQPTTTRQTTKPATKPVSKPATKPATKPAEKERTLIRRKTTFVLPQEREKSKPQLGTRTDTQDIKLASEVESSIPKPDDETKEKETYTIEDAIDIYHKEYTRVKTKTTLNGVRSSKVPRIKSGKSSSVTNPYTDPVSRVPPWHRKEYILTKRETAMYKHISNVYSSEKIKKNRENQFYKKLLDLQLEEWRQAHSEYRKQRYHKFETQFNQQRQLKRVRDKFEQEQFERFRSQYVTSKVLTHEWTTRHDYGLPEDLGDSPQYRAKLPHKHKKPKPTFSFMDMYKQDKKKYETIFKHTGLFERPNAKPPKMEGIDTIDINSADGGGERRTSVKAVVEDAQQLLDDDDSSEYETASSDDEEDLRPSRPTKQKSDLRLRPGPTKREPTRGPVTTHNKGILKREPTKAYGAVRREPTKAKTDLTRKGPGNRQKTNVNSQKKPDKASGARNPTTSNKDNEREKTVVKSNNNKPVLKKQPTRFRSELTTWRGPDGANAGKVNEGTEPGTETGDAGAETSSSKPSHKRPGNSQAATNTEPTADDVKKQHVTGDSLHSSQKHTDPHNKGTRQGGIAVNTSGPSDTNDTQSTLSDDKPQQYSSNNVDLTDPSDPTHHTPGEQGVQGHERDGNSEQGVQGHERDGNSEQGIQGNKRDGTSEQRSPHSSNKNDPGDSRETNHHDPSTSGGANTPSDSRGADSEPNNSSQIDVNKPTPDNTQYTSSPKVSDSRERTNSPSGSHREGNKHQPTNQDNTSSDAEPNDSTSLGNAPTHSSADIGRKPYEPTANKNNSQPPDTVQPIDKDMQSTPTESRTPTDSRTPIKGSGSQTTPRSNEPHSTKPADRGTKDTSGHPRAAPRERTLEKTQPKDDKKVQGETKNKSGSSKNDTPKAQPPTAKGDQNQPKRPNHGDQKQRTAPSKDDPKQPKTPNKSDTNQPSPQKQSGETKPSKQHSGTDKAAAKPPKGKPTSKKPLDKSNPRSVSFALPEGNDKKKKPDVPNKPKTSREKSDPDIPQMKPKAKGAPVNNDLDDMYGDKPKKKPGKKPVQTPKEKSGKRDKKRPSLAEDKENEPVYMRDTGRPDIPNANLVVSDDESDSDEDIFAKAMRKYGIEVDSD